MFDAIKQGCQNYYNQIPDNSLPTIGKSAILSFTITILLSRGTLPNICNSSLEDFRRPLSSAGFAALAAVVHALTTPIFNKIFGDNNQNNFYRESIKHVFNVSLVRFAILQAGGLVEIRSLLPINWLVSCIQLIPSYFSLFDPKFGKDGRLFLKDWGLKNARGANSTYIVA